MKFNFILILNIVICTPNFGSRIDQFDEISTIADRDIAMDQIVYRVRIGADESQRYLEVEIKYLPALDRNGLGYTNSFLEVPAHAQDMQALDSDACCKPYSTGLVEVKYLGSRPKIVNVSYRVYPQKKLKTPYRSFDAKAQFRLLGSDFLAFPQRFYDAANKSNISIYWHVPTGWTVINSAGVVDKTKQEFKMTIPQLRRSAFIAGEKFELVEQNAGALFEKYPVYIAIFSESNGDASPNYAHYSRRVAQSLSYAREFWRDANSSTYLIVLEFRRDGPCGQEFDGEAFFHSLFASIPSVDCMRERFYKSKLGEVFLHEAFHNWNIARNFYSTAGNTNTSLDQWFIEGFTVYYAFMLAMRIEQDTEAAIALLDGKLSWLYRNTHRYKSNAQLAKLLESRNLEAIRMIYARGAYVALNWDSRIRNATTGQFSLDDLMRDLLAAGQAGEPVLDKANLNRHMKKYLPEGIDHDYEKLLMNGADVLPDPDALGPCVKIEGQTPRLVIDKEMWRRTPDVCMKRFNVPKPSASSLAAYRARSLQTH